MHTFTAPNLIRRVQQKVVKLITTSLLVGFLPIVGGVLTGAVMAPQAKAAVTWSAFSTAGSAYTCSPNFYQVSAGKYYRFDPATKVYTQLGTASISSLNALGYNPADNYIYGNTGTTLYKINSAGGYATATLSSTAQTTGGDFIKPNLMVTASQTGTWTSIDVLSGTVTTLTSSGTWGAFDLSIQNGNTAYGLDKGTLYKAVFTPSGTTYTVAVTSVALANSSSVDQDNYGAAYSDVSNNLYFFSNTQHNLWEITNAELQKANPTAVKITSAGTLSSPNDGASCSQAASPLDPPTPIYDSYTVAESGTITTTSPNALLANDQYISNSFAVDTVTGTSSANWGSSGSNTTASGSITYSSLANFKAGIFTYTPTPGFTGTDTATYWLISTDTTPAVSKTSATINFNVVGITTPSPLPGGLVGSGYSKQLAAGGNISGFSYSVGSGLPTGLTLSASGLIYGTPTTAGTYTFTVTLTNGSVTTSQVFTLVVTAPSYLITFDTNTSGVSGSIAAPISMAGPTALPAPGVTKTGYSFTGWNTIAGGTGTAYQVGDTYTPVAAATLYAQWTPTSYKITYDPNGGSVTTTSQNFTVAAPATIIDSSTATRTGYTFAGWYPNSGGTGSPVAVGSSYSTAGNITLYAKWTANSYTISYNAGAHGTGTMGNQTFTLALIPSIAASTFSASGSYTFSGWQVTSGTATYSPGDSYTVASDLSLTAMWVANTQYTVTYDANGGTGAPSQSAFTPPTETATIASTAGVTRTGYTMAGWNVQPNGGGKSYGPGDKYGTAANLKLYAVWTPITYRITYDANGGSGAPGDRSFTLNAPATIDTTSALVRSGYVNSGWSTQPNGGGTLYQPGDVYSTASNLQLYALWTAISYQVDYNPNGATSGTTPASTPFTVTSAATISDNTGTLAKTGSTFGGWNTQPNGSGSSYSAGDTFGYARNLTLYAQWIPLGVYTVSYDPNGGSGSVTTQSFTAGDSVTITSGSVLTRTGYTFAGWWNSNSGGSGTSYVPGDHYSTQANLTLFAVWIPINYQVTYDGNGATGNAPTTQSFTVASPVTISDNSQATPLTYSGFAFAGWNTKADGSGNTYSPNDSYNNASNLILYAVWTPVVYTVSYDANGGSGTLASNADTFTVVAGATIETTTGISLTGYVLSGWNTAADGSGSVYNPGTSYNQPSNLQLYANWIPAAKYVVSYDANGGSSAPAQQLFTGGVDTVTIASAGSITRSGYTFNGWNTKADGTGGGYAAGDQYSESANLRLYADWVINNYKVTYDANGGTGAPGDQSFTVANPAVIETTTGITRTGYTIAGWWNSARAGSAKTYVPGDVYADPANLTLFAQWEAIQYEVTYDANGGTGITPTTQTLTVASPINISGNTTATPLTRDGYVFGGWNTAADGSGTTYQGGDAYSGSANRILYAIWTPLGSYTVTYDVNGVSVSAPADQTFADGTSVTLDNTVASASVSGYTFVGWNTKADGTGTTYLSNTVYSDSANLALYAIWAANDYRVTYDANGGTGNTPAGQNFTVASPATIADNTGSPALTRTGYIFDGWNSARDASQTSYAAGDTYNAASNLDLFAVWTPIIYQVNYDLNNADPSSVAPASETFTITTSANISDSSTVSKSGYRFVGWNTKADGSGVPYIVGDTYSSPADLLLYAQWLTNSQHILTYDANGGSTAAPLTPVTFGSSYSGNVTSVVPTRSGYTFTGWWNTARGGGGSPYASGAPLSISGDLGLFAQWSIDSHTVTYNINGGTGTLAKTIDTFTVESAATIAATSGISRDGYSLFGWNTAADGSGDQYTPGDLYNLPVNLNLYAVWVINNYKLSYDANGGYGTTPADQSFTVANPATVSGQGSILRDWYSFTGWYTNAAGTGGTAYAASSTYNSANDQILYAQWTPRTYTITYNANGGTGSVGPDTVSATSNTLIETTTGFTYGSYTIAGWNTAADGSGATYQPGDPYIEAADITLYAIWPGANQSSGGAPSNPIYRVAFNLNGGSGATPAAYSAPSGSTITLPGNSGFSNPGFTFGGWSTQPNGGGNIYAAGTSYSIGSSVNLYAVWIPVVKNTAPGAPNPTPAPTTVEPGGILTRTVTAKAVQPNQIVSIGEQIHLSIDPTSSVKEVFVNGKPVVTKTNTDGSLKLVNLVGPKDKVVVEVKQSDGTTTEVPVTESNSLVDLANVNFDLASAALTPAAKKILDNVAKVVLQHGFTKLDLAGHTDSLGSGTYDNQTLSHQRAVAVEIYLKAKLATHHVSVKLEAKAEVDPIAANETAAGRAINRRVEIKVA